VSLGLDKSAWKRVAFGDVVKNVNVSVKDPEEAGIERVIAMEHLDPGELSISRWGDTADATTFTRRVKRGQTLFGKRRAYQGKAAYADFDAICSGDILVFEADATRLLAEFLPFLVQSNPFYDHALGTSAGSLSPRTNWSDLANFQFHLPPLDEQNRLAGLLWAVERHRRALSGKLAPRVAATSALLVDDVLASAAGSATQLDSLIREGTSITYGIVQAGPEVEEGVPYIRVSDMASGTLSPIRMKRTAPEIAARFTRSRVEAGDLVVALRGRTGLTLPVPGSLAGANLTQGTARVAVDRSAIEPAYVTAVMNSRWMASQIERQAKGSTFTELTLASLRSLRIPRLGSRGEAKLLTELNRATDAGEHVRREIDALIGLRLAIYREVFGGVA
jgi:type I restriction enzyme, S subunit